MFFRLAECEASDYAGFMRLLVALLLLPLVAGAQGADRATEIELQRIDQRMVTIVEENDFLKRQMRILEKDNAEMKAQMEKLLKQTTGLNDDMIRVLNVDIPNFHASQIQFEDKLKNDYNADYDAFRESINKREDEFNWGHLERACPEVGAKHQEVKWVSKDEGKTTLQFLCFDGKVLHMGTQLNALPE